MQTEEIITERIIYNQTKADYDKTSEGEPCQLINGKTVYMPSPIPTHQEIMVYLTSVIFFFARKNKSGKVYSAPMDVEFDNINIFQPDLLFIGEDSLDIIGKKRIVGAPDLTVEILSPTTSKYDLKEKKEVYAKYGVKEYWIIDPETKLFEVHQLEGAEYILSFIHKSGIPFQSTVLKGIEINFDELFPQ